MSTYEEVKEIKTLWRGKPQSVTFNLGVKEIHVGWNEKREQPIKVLEFNPNEDGIELFVLGRSIASIILVQGSMTIRDVKHIQKFRHLIQIFSERNPFS